jgi:hypothetical protein
MGFKYRMTGVYSPIEAKCFAYQKWNEINHAPFEVFLLDCQVNDLLFNDNGIQLKKGVDYINAQLHNPLSKFK